MSHKSYCRFCLALAHFLGVLYINSEKSKTITPNLQPFILLSRYFRGLDRLGKFLPYFRRDTTL